MTAVLTALAGAVYGAAGLLLAILGLHALVLATVRVLLPRRDLPAATGPWPAVVVQLPVYEEPPALAPRRRAAQRPRRHKGRRHDQRQRDDRLRPLYRRPEAVSFVVVELEFFVVQDTQ